MSQDASGDEYGPHGTPTVDLGLSFKLAVVSALSVAALSLVDSGVVSGLNLFELFNMSSSTMDSVMDALTFAASRGGVTLEDAAKWFLGGMYSTCGVASMLSMIFNCFGTASHARRSLFDENGYEAKLLRKFANELKELKKLWSDGPGEDPVAELMPPQ